MRIVRRGEKEQLQALVTEKRVAPAEASRTVEFGKEDYLLLIVLLILAIGYLRGQLSIQEVLAYLGVSTTGGVWGLIGGSSSSK
jgi:hypothetical protein